MENDDKDDGYSEEEEEDLNWNYDFRNMEPEERMFSQIPGDSMSAEQMADVLVRNLMFEKPFTVELLAECAGSDYWLPRQAAARKILKAVQLAVRWVEANSDRDDIETVFFYMNKLSKDKKGTVRDKLLDSLLEVIKFCAEYESPTVYLKDYIEPYILPIVLKAIADEDEGFNIRKKGYDVLRYLLNNELVSKTSIQNKIGDICENLLKYPLDVISIVNAGNFISRMAPIVGEATTEKLLLPKISNLCNNQFEKVREACCYFLVDLACFVNPLVTENIIIPLFIKLSEDEKWCVRRACAETTVILSCLCLMETRKMVLSRVFLNLLQDSYVTSIARKQLGPFISTFAQPGVIGLGCNRNGDFVLMSHQGSCFEFLSRRSIFQFQEQPEESDKYCMFMLPMKSDNSGSSSDSCNPNNTWFFESESYNLPNNFNELPGVQLVNKDSEFFLNQNKENNSEMDRQEGENNEAVMQNDNVDESSDVQTTYFPFPQSTEMNADYLNERLRNQPDLVQSCIVPSTFGNQTRTWYNRSESSNFGSEESSKLTTQSNFIPFDDSSDLINDFNSFQFWRAPIAELDENEVITTPESVNDVDISDMTTNLPYQQSDEFQFVNERSNETEKDNVSSVRNDASEITSKPAMIVPIRQNILPQMLLDAFISLPDTMPFYVRRECAYTFPAVALTLGMANWFLLKNAYCKLAVDSEWKVRQAIASSIHEIASILGPQLATDDLIPIYNRLINDVEDVRTTALKHLTCFVKLLKPYGRCRFLPHLTEYVMADYSWNWRFRKQLCDQLVEMMDLFSPGESWKYLSPVVFNLLMDRVSEVRLQALTLVIHLIRVVSADMSILRGILAELAERFAHSKQWAYRQSFAFLCSSLSRTPVLPGDMFARDVLPHLLDLSWDNVPNVRIAVARTLSSDLIQYPNFEQHFSAHYDVIREVLKRLSKDKDRDVRYFAELNSNTSLPSVSGYKNNDANVKDDKYDLAE